jgi:hypothetical protein
MFDRLKQAVVESYVGAIALGYLFAQLAQHFVNIFASPIAGWVARKQYGAFAPRTSPLWASHSKMRCLSWSHSFYSCCSGLFCYAGSTSKPLKKETSEPVPNPEQAG